jgi:hypothetical protein
MPGLSSSPRIRSVPHGRFSRDILMMRSCTAGLRCGRPPRERDFQRQHRRQPRRCQRTTGSGRTITGCSRPPAHQRRASTHISLSQRHSRARGRVRVGRVRTAIWWRKSRFSRTGSCRGRTQTRMVVRTSQSSSSTPSAWLIWRARGFAPAQPPGAATRSAFLTMYRWRLFGSLVATHPTITGDGRADGSESFETVRAVCGRAVPRDEPPEARRRGEGGHALRTISSPTYRCPRSWKGTAPRS